MSHFEWTQGNFIWRVCITLWETQEERLEDSGKRLTIVWYKQMAFFCAGQRGTKWTRSCQNTTSRAARGFPACFHLPRIQAWLYILYRTLWDWLLHRRSWPPRCCPKCRPCRRRSTRRYWINSKASKWIPFSHLFYQAMLDEMLEQTHELSERLNCKAIYDASAIFWRHKEGYIVTRKCRRSGGWNRHLCASLR